MRERDLFLAMLQPGVYVARIVERFYGAPNWVVVEEFDVSRDIAGIVEAAQPKDVEPEPGEPEGDGSPSDAEPAGELQPEDTEPQG